MNWIVAGLIAGVGAFFADWFMWSKVFMKGMDAYSTPVPPEQMQRLMAANMPKSAVLALVFGVVLSGLYYRFMSALWVAPGPLAGMELATILWLPVVLAALGSGVWYDRLRRFLSAMTWSWLVRMNVAGVIVGVFVHRALA